MTATDPIWDGYVPPRIDTTGPKPDQDRMPIFYVTVPTEVEGQTEEKVFTAPRRVSAPVALQALRMTAVRGPEAGTWLMVEESLSEEAMEVLTTCEHLTYEDAQKILTQLGRLYYGQAQALKDPGGK